MKVHRHIIFEPTIEPTSRAQGRRVKELYKGIFTTEEQDANFRDLICVHIRLKESTSFKMNLSLKLLQGAVNIYLNFDVTWQQGGIIHNFILKTELELEYGLE